MQIKIDYYFKIGGVGVRIFFILCPNLALACICFFLQKMSKYSMLQINFQHIFFSSILHNMQYVVCRAKLVHFSCVRWVLSLRTSFLHKYLYLNFHDILFFCILNNMAQNRDSNPTPI